MAGTSGRSTQRRGCCWPFSLDLKRHRSRSLLWQAGPPWCEGPPWPRATMPPACKGPLQPYGDPNSYITSSICGGPRVPTKFKTTQLVEPPSSSPAHQHPIPQKMGPFNRSKAGPGVFATRLIETYVQHIETQGLPFSVWETSDCFSKELGGNPSQNALQAFVGVHAREQSSACAHGWPFSSQLYRSILGGLVLLSLISWNWHKIKTESVSQLTNQHNFYF